MVGDARKLKHDEAGISFVEGLIVFPLVLLTIVTLIELGMAVYQWNQTTKAVNLGARLAAVSDPVATNYKTLLTADYDANNVGKPTPTTPISIVCTLGAANCSDTALTRLVRGSDGACNSNFGSGVPGMCDLNPAIGPANVQVTYYRSGLGYIGRPDGPVSTITVQVRNLQFNFFLLGALLGLNSLPIPAQPVTVTSEDLSSTK